MIRKAVIPAAGLGTRMLPATRTVPKEMFPVVDRPVIQYVVEEAIASGIEEIVIVISPDKASIQEHFAADPVSSRITYVTQSAPRGLGDAILCARGAVEDEPFAILLGDNIMDADVPVTQQLARVHDRTGASVVALEEVPREKVRLYGIAGGSMTEARLMKIERLLEKPLLEEAPSNLAVAGRYVLTPDIFSCLERITRGKNNELQLTDALALMITEQPVYGLRFEGTRHDIGSHADFIRANVALGLKRKDLNLSLGKNWKA